MATQGSENRKGSWFDTWTGNSCVAEVIDRTTDNESDAVGDLNSWDINCHKTKQKRKKSKKKKKQKQEEVGAEWNLSAL